MYPNNIPLKDSFHLICSIPSFFLKIVCFSWFEVFKDRWGLLAWHVCLLIGMLMFARSCKEKKISFFLVFDIPISDTIFMQMILEPLLLYYWPNWLFMDHAAFNTSNPNSPYRAVSHPQCTWRYLSLLLSFSFHVRLMLPFADSCFTIKLSSEIEWMKKLLIL